MGRCIVAVAFIGSESVKAECRNDNLAKHGGDSHIGIHVDFQRSLRASIFAVLGPFDELVAFSRFSSKRNGGAILILRCFSSIISNLDSTTSLRLCNGQCIEYRLFRINLHALECDCCCLLVLNDYLFYLLCIVNIQAMPLRCFAVHHINFTASDIAYQYLQFAVISGLNDEFATAVG